MVTGRFAPSPTGPLHMGSLVAALASWLDARASGGRWLLRIEDLDRARCVPGAAEEILRALERLGLTWDGDITWQTQRVSLYEAALEKLRGKTYWCGCSRREIADSSLGLAADGAQIYPATCRPGLDGKPRRALRVRTGSEEVRFEDRVQGPQSQVLERVAGQRARLLEQDYFLAEHHQRRNRADAERTGELLLLVGVHFREHHVGMRVGRLLVHRRKTAARAAPRGPEVDDDHWVVGDRAVEVFLRELDGRHDVLSKKGGSVL
jgi:tRNA synthetases class I (E and Q), catalytic domain